MSGDLVIISKHCMKCPHMTCLKVKSILCQLKIDFETVLNRSGFDLSRTHLISEQKQGLRDLRFNLSKQLIVMSDGADELPRQLLT